MVKLPEAFGQQFALLASVLIGNHFESVHEQLGDPAVYGGELIDRLADTATEVFDALHGAPENGSGALAELVVRLLPLTHAEYCRQGANKAFCESDIRFCASMCLILGPWLLNKPFVHEPSEVIGQAMKLDLPGFQRDMLEVLLDEILAPAAVHRAVPNIEEDKYNLQINAPITDPSFYSENRATSQYLKMGLSGRPLNVELTSDWAPPATSADTASDETVDGAIFLTDAMVLFASTGGIGTGDTMRLASQLMIPTLVLRKETEGSDQAGRTQGPLQARRRGTLSLRIERTYRSPEEAQRHVEEFLDKFANQIAARHEFLLRIKRDGASINEVREAVMALDAAVFENARITRAAALFVTSNPLFWYQAGDLLRNEVARLIGSPRSERRPGELRMRQGQGSPVGAVGEALRRERQSVRNLMVAAELSGWSFENVATLLGEHAKREARQGAVHSHVITPRSVSEWEILNREVFGS